MAGSVQAPQNYYGGGGGGAISQSPSLYAPVGVGNMINNSPMNFAPNGSSNVNISGSTGTINVQTNIDNSKTIDSSSNISVTETINGSYIGYGLGGSGVLNVIDQTASTDASVSDGVKTNATTAVDAGLMAAELQN